MASKPEEKKRQKRKRDNDGSTSESSSGNSEITCEGENRDTSSSSQDISYDDTSSLASGGKRRRRGSGRSEYSSDEKEKDRGCCPHLRRQSSSDKILTTLNFAFPLPRKPPPSAPQFSLEQGHRLKLTVTHREPHYVFTVVAVEKKLQKQKLKWPLKDNFLLQLHKTKDREGMPMEADCSGPGEECCSLEVDENDIARYVEKDTLHAILKLSR